MEIARGLPVPHNSRALFVGSGTFERLDDLPAVANNLMTLRDLFRGEVWNLPSAGCTELLNPTSTRQVSEAVRNVCATATDALLIYYAGHGLLDDKGYLHLAMPDSDPDSVYDTALPYQWIRRAMESSRAKRRIVVLDCCYSARAMGSQSERMVDLADVDGTYLLAAAAETAVAVAPPGETYTAFSGALVRVLTDGVADEKQLLSLNDVFRSVRSVLTQARRPDPQSSCRNQVGNLPFTRNPSYAHTHGAQADLQSTIQNLHAAGSLADTLQTAADGVVTGLGYKLACVNLVQPDGDLVVAAFSGNPAAEALITGRIGGRASWERRLSMGERWGELRFIPHHEGVVLLEDDVPQWHTEGPEPRFEDEWHPRDRLYAPMYSPGGDRDLLGVISVDWPRDGRRPDPEQRGNLAAYAAHAAVAIANARLWANSRRALVRLEREQQALRASEESFRQAFEYAPSGMAIAEMGGDQHGRLVRTNDALCRLLDRSASAIRRYSFSDLVHPEDIGTLLRTSAEGGRAELRLARRDNSYVWVSLRNSVVADATDGPRFLLTHVEDIEERKRNELQLAHRASHDTLTGLPNSAELLAHLASLVCEDTDPDAQEDMWAPGNTYQPSYADYDHQHLRRPPASSTWPKRGHAILICQLTDWNNIRRRSRDDADTVLIETTRRLSAAAGAASLGPAGAVYRSDIDEFLILAPDIDPEGLKMLVDQIRAAVGDPPPDALWHRPVTARWGVGWVECGTEGAELLRSVREGLSL